MGTKTSGKEIESDTKRKIPEMIKTQPEILSWSKKETGLKQLRPVLRQI